MDLLYHYTNISGFMGIMESVKDTGNLSLRMSSALYMNDRRELIQSVRVLNEILQTIDKNSSLAEKIQLLSSKDDNTILKYFTTYIFNSHLALITCFTSERDNLPIWGRYAENGNGIAIGFDRKELEKELSNSLNPGVSVFNTCYSDGNVDEWIYDLINKERQTVKNDDLVIKQLIMELCSIIKSPYFSYEKETRAVSYYKKSNPDLNFRESRGYIAPYRMLRISQKIVKEIILGPSKDPYLFRNSIIDFCFHHHRMEGSSKMIVNSNIPFRGNE